MISRILLVLGWIAVVVSIAIQTYGSFNMLGSAWPWVFISIAVGCAAWLRNEKLAWGVAVAVLWPIAVVLMAAFFMGAP